MQLLPLRVVPKMLELMSDGHVMHAAAPEPDTPAAATVVEPGAGEAALPAGFFEAPAEPEQDTAYQEAGPGPPAPAQSPAVEEASATAIPKGAVMSHVLKRRSSLACNAVSLVRLRVSSLSFLPYSMICQGCGFQLLKGRKGGSPS